MTFSSSHGEYKKNFKNTDEGNVTIVKNKIPKYVVVYESYTEKHFIYLSHITDESNILSCYRHFYRESARKDDFCRGLQKRIWRKQKAAQFFP